MPRRNDRQKLKGLIGSSSKIGRICFDDIDNKRSWMLMLKTWTKNRYTITAIESIVHGLDKFFLKNITWNSFFVRLFRFDHQRKIFCRNETIFGR